MHLLDETPGHRKAFERAFDRLTSPMLNAYAAAYAAVRAKVLLREFSRADVIDLLPRAYYVNEDQARRAVMSA